MPQVKKNLKIYFRYKGLNKNKVDTIVPMFFADFLTDFVNFLSKN